MILECPRCGTYYDTPAIIPPEGRKVRCAKCANAWLAMPSSSEASESPNEPELSDSERNVAVSGARPTAEQEDAGGAVASDESAGDEALEEFSAGERTGTQISVEEEEPESAVEDAAPTARDEAAAEQAAMDAEMDDPGDAPEYAPAGGESASEDAASTAEQEPAPTEDDAPVREAEEADQEAPIGEISHRGAGPARSPMQENLRAAESQAAELAPVEAASDEAAGGDQLQSVEPVASEEIEVVVVATEVEIVEVLAPERAEPASDSPAEVEAQASLAGAETEAAEPEPDGGGENAAADQPAAAAAAAAGEDFQPSTGQLVSWALLALLVVIGFTLAVVNREMVVRAVPGSASFYGGLGLAVNLRGLDFENVTSTWTTEAGQQVLEVRGEIVNITDGQIAVPTVVFALHDENGVEVHQWEAEVTNKPLEGGGRTQFTARIPSPPASSKSVQVKFAAAR